MAKRVNLCPNPALKSNSTGWAFPSGYARSTSVTTLPRTTGVKGTSAPSAPIIGPQTPVVTGSQYCVSFSIHYTNVSGTNTFDYGIDWYNSSGSYLSSTAYSTRTSAAFGITERLEHGPMTAPTNAAKAVLVLSNLDSGCEVTAVLFEQTSTTGQSYFDGDTTGAGWLGTVGNSASQILTATDAWSWTDSASKTATASGPSGSDSITWSESASIVASGQVDDYWTWSDSALVIELGYDERRGRVRVGAFGLDSDAVRAVVQSRLHGSGKWYPVRGGKVAVSGGHFARTVDDYEFPSGAAVDYQIVAYASVEGAPDDIVTSAYATQPAIDPETWLKFIAKPPLNQRLTLVGWGDIARANRNARFDVRNRPDPIMVTDVHSSRTVTISLRTEDEQTGDALDAALSAGYPAFLHTPVGLALPTMYVTIGDYHYARPSSYSHVRTWTVDLVEVAPPPPSVFGPPTTWQTIIDSYSSWADVIAAFPTWRDLMGG